MKALRYAIAFGVIASVTSAYTVIGWTELDMPAVITGPRKNSNAQQWLLRNLESLVLKDGLCILKFKELTEDAPTSGHPAAPGDSVRGKELILSKRGDMFCLGEATSCIFIVKRIDAKGVLFAYEWEGMDLASDKMQIDRGDFSLHAEDLPQRPNQPPEPTAMSVTPPAAQEPRQP